MGDKLTFDISNDSLIFIALIIGLITISTPSVFAMECQQENDPSFELILNCIDTIDVKKGTMELMYGDVSRFSSSLEGAQVYDIKTDSQSTFATLEIPLPLASNLKSDVKFTKSSNYSLDFLNGDLMGSSLLISLKEIDGYDGTEKGGSEVNFIFKIDKLPCFAFGLKCGTAGDFEYALDRGLYLIESEAKKLQVDLDENPEIQIDSDGTKTFLTNNQNVIKDSSKMNYFKGPPRIDSDDDGISDSVDDCLFEKETYNGYLDNDGCSDIVPLAENQTISKSTSNWLKINAEWYANDIISDKEFAQSIEFLIDKELIFIKKPVDLNASAFSNDAIPVWIQKSAGWWAEGMISDLEFVKIIEYMTIQNILKTDTTNYDKN